MQGDQPGAQTQQMNAEYHRLDESRAGTVPWYKWGPYLSERQWGTVREDYSANGDAWDYFTHDQASLGCTVGARMGSPGFRTTSRYFVSASRFGNGVDPILKERMFGLTNSEGNHGEDLKEYYFYIDSTPTHSYMKMLYKYPQKAYPYDDLVKTNKGRSRSEPEYELLDTGVFDQNEYFDVFAEYAKAGADDLLISITVWNRGGHDASLHLLPTLWFRNTWWEGKSTEPKPILSVNKDGSGIRASHATFGEYELQCEGAPAFLFTNNETNEERLGGKSATPYTKDAFHRYVLQKDAGAVNQGKRARKRPLTTNWMCQPVRVRRSGCV